MKSIWMGRRWAATVLVMGLVFLCALVGTTPAAAAPPAISGSPAASVAIATADGLQVRHAAATALSELPASAAVANRPAPSDSPGSEMPSPLRLAPFLIGMTALARDRDTPRRDGRLIGYLVGAAKKIYAGSLVVLKAGYAEPGTAALNLKAVGRANETVDNSGGAAGALSVLVERGTFLFAQDGSITQADVGGTCYIVDDQTVAKTDGSGARSAAGTIRGVEAGGVWVEI